MNTAGLLQSLFTGLAALFVVASGCATSQQESTDDVVEETESSETESLGTDETVELNDSDIIPVGDSPRTGADDAWVTAVVFADFQCAFCGRLAATLDEIEREYDDQTLRVVFKHLPLEMHEAALPAAQAAEAARRQGQFWEMHDALFDSLRQFHNADDPEAVVFELAERLQLDLEQFRRDFESDEIAARIEADRQLAEDLNIDSAPAVFINGGYIPGARPAEVYRTAIDNVEAILREGVSRGDIAREDVYRNSVESLYSHTAPGEVAEERRAPSIADVPIGDENPQTAPVEDALVHIAVFASLGEPPTHQLQREFDEVVDGDEAIRITYFHMPNNTEDSVALAHRALHGADSGEQTRQLMSWLVDDVNDWRENSELLHDYLEDRGIEPVEEQALVDVVRRHRSVAESNGIYGTPTFFVNGIRRVGVPEDFSEVEDLIAEQRSLATRVREIMGYTGVELYEEMIQGNRQRRE